MRTVASTILTSQSNEVHSAIVAEGLDTAAFHWDTVQSSKTQYLAVSELRYADTRYFFLFDFHQDQHWCEFSPGRDKLADTDYPGTWGGTLAYFRQWLEYLKREVFAIDLWAAAQSQTAFIHAQSESDTESPFTLEERERIQTSINEIKEFVFKAQPLSEAHMRYVEGRLNYLVDASNRMGRKDWANVAIGVFTNIVVSAALNPEATRDFFQFVGAALSWVFGQRALP